VRLFLDQPLGAAREGYERLYSNDQLATPLFVVPNTHHTAIYENDGRDPARVRETRLLYFSWGNKH
jgi:hypothetical protein